MQDRLAALLRMQGFCVANDAEARGISGRARWTPLSCATFGAFGLGVGSNVLSLGVTLCPCILASVTGLWLGSGWFFIGLGVLTFTGGVSVRSIYDRLYNLVIPRVFHGPAVPKHGPQRRFGCAIGGIMYTLSGIGFLTHNSWLALLPALLMIVLATVAGTTHWCFASALYNALLRRRKPSTAR